MAHETCARQHPHYAKIIIVALNCLLMGVVILHNSLNAVVPNLFDHVPHSKILHMCSA